nr:hypothetical protein CPGR_00966 [Mycolicibacter nonchromogenicus]
MRKLCWVTSLQYSLARYFAMPAATSLRSPESFRRAALTTMRWAASTLVAISASPNATAWCSAIGLPKVLRCWAYRAASSKARMPTPQARAATLTRPTSIPSIIW